MSRLVEGLKGLSKYKWALAFLASCLLAFAGPTYIIYALEKLELAWPLPTVIGFSLFIIGFLAVAYIFSKGLLKTT